MNLVRTRFAPSPTGALHAGTMRTALFAWIIAAQKNGEFILRIEDTDQSREVEGATKNIIDSLKYLDIEWQEGPEIGGPYKPYFQSKRLDIYKQWAEKLIAQGRAYADPYSIEELNQLREKAKSSKQPFLFRNHRPDNPPVWDGTQPLRFKSNPKEYKWNDSVLGELHSGEEVIDDFIIIKSDGFPTYNFAHIVDDYLMKITHVVRSQEFTSSMPKFLNLYEALGLELPIFVTLPPVLDKTGKQKLSKRHGAEQILEYKKRGYLPEAMINFLATLGWNDGTQQEIFTPEEIVSKFDIKRVQKGGAIFDEQRLLWISGNHIRSKSLGDLMNSIDEKFWPEASKNFDKSYKLEVLKILQERLKFFAELKDLSTFFFEEPKVSRELLLESKLDMKTMEKYISAALASLKTIEFSNDEIENTMRSLCEKLKAKPSDLFKIIRISVTGSTVAPGLFETIGVLGKDRVTKRLQNTLESLPK